ncbi:MAG: VOC family protein [Pseudomonadota bacterium]
MNTRFFATLVLSTAVLGGASAQEDSAAVDAATASPSYVTGIGGFFFRSEDPEALEQWYEANLGINQPPKSYDDAVWRQEAGTTIFHPFVKDTEYFGDPDKQFMLNFRVRNLDGLVAHLRKNGNEVEVDPMVYPNGRFARLADPEGNPIQLWEPAEVAAE